VKAGPKSAVDPSQLSFKSRTTGAKRFDAFCRGYVIVPKGKGALKPLRLRPWQVGLVGSALDPDPPPSLAGRMLPRGQGKSAGGRVGAVRPNARRRGRLGGCGWPRMSGRRALCSAPPLAGPTSILTTEIVRNEIAVPPLGGQPAALGWRVARRDLNHRAEATVKNRPGPRPALPPDRPTAERRHGVPTPYPARPSAASPRVVGAPFMIKDTDTPPTARSTRAVQGGSWTR
jgi:hypothetical protein